MAWLVSIEGEFILTKKPFAIWVMVVGQGFIATIFSLLFEKAFTGAGGVRSNNLDFAILAVLFASAAIACFSEKRWGYAYSAGLSVFVLLLFNIDVVSYLYTPANYQFFVADLAGLSVLPLIVFFSIQSFRNSKGLPQKKYLATPTSAGGLLTVAVIGFLVGGSLAGLTSGATVNSLLSSNTSAASESGVIAIVKGANLANNPQFYVPATVTVVIGVNDTITWVNDDVTAHTVTSTNPQGLFDSGTFGTGAKWSYTFTQPGTYSYYCTIHPFMKGTVVVKQG